jgi:hypothetical protein
MEFLDSARGRLDLLMQETRGFDVRNGQAASGWSFISPNHRKGERVAKGEEATRSVGVGISWGNIFTMLSMRPRSQAPE